MDDGKAMDLIRAAMSGCHWSPDTLDTIAEIVERTGRHIEPPEV